MNEGSKKAENYDPVIRRFGIEPDFSFIEGGPEKTQKSKKENEPSRGSKREEEKEISLQAFLDFSQKHGYREKEIRQEMN